MQSPGKNICCCTALLHRWICPNPAWWQGYPPASRSAPVQHSWQWRCEEAGKASVLFFHLKTCYSTIIFFFLLKACCLLQVIRVLIKGEKPERGFCLVVEVRYSFWLLSQEKSLFSLNRPLCNIVQCLWTAATVSLANAQINRSNQIVLRSSRKPTASLSSWPSPQLPVFPALFLMHLADFGTGLPWEMSCSEAPVAENP